MAKEKKTKTADAPGGYHITWPSGSTVTGHVKYVQFWHGQGVLNLSSLAAKRPDWVIAKDGKLKQVAGVGIEYYAAYFKKLGCKVKAMPEEDSQKLLEKMAADPDALEPKPEEKEPKRKNAGAGADKNARAAAKERGKEPKPPHET